jgi:hypothetical protein
MDLVQIAITAGVFIGGSIAAYFLGKNKAAKKFVDAAGALIGALADGKITIEEAQQVASKVKALFTKES